MSPKTWIMLIGTVAACQKAGLMPPPGWVEPDPDGKSLAMDMSILEDGKSRLETNQSHLLIR